MVHVEKFYSGIRWIDPGSNANIGIFGAFGEAARSRRPPEREFADPTAGVALATREIAELLVIWTRFSRGFARTHDTQTLYAMDAKGGGRSSAIIRKMSENRSRGIANSAIWNAT